MSQSYGEQLTLTLRVATWNYAHHGIMEIIFPKLFLQFFSSLKVMKRTENVEFLILDL
jgi:hypothetical protein